MTIVSGIDFSENATQAALAAAAIAKRLSLPLKLCHVFVKTPMTGDRLDH